RARRWRDKARPAARRPERIDRPPRPPRTGRRRPRRARASPSLVRRPAPPALRSPGPQRPPRPWPRRPDFAPASRSRRRTAPPRRPPAPPSASDSIRPWRASSTVYGLRTQSCVETIGVLKSTTSKSSGVIFENDRAVTPTLASDHLAVVVRSSAKVSAIVPPSESSIPYFFIAAMITFSPALYEEASKAALRRNRTP